MAHDLIIQGNESGAARANKGWVMGHFMPPGPAHQEGFEAKMWSYDGPIDYPMKQFNGVELIAIYGGEIVIHIEEEGGTHSLVLVGDSREYVILPAGTKKRVEVTKFPAFGMTVRTPSVEGGNVVLWKK